MRTAPRWLVVAVAAAALAIAAASCGGDDGGGTGGGDGGGGSGPTVTMQDFAFDPATLTVTAGQDTTISLVNEDGAEHSFTLDDDSASQDVEGGESASVTINVSGPVGWHCKYHPDTMKGTIQVA